MVYRQSQKVVVCACDTCNGDLQVCNECEKPGLICKCPDRWLPTPMPCPKCYPKK